MTIACSGCPALGIYGKLLLEPGASPHTFDASSERYEFRSEKVQSHPRLLNTQGITGLRRRLASRVRLGASYIFGSIVLNPSPGYFETLLPKILGAKADGTFKADTCPTAFGAMLDRDLDVWTYSDCYCAGWELFGEAPAWKETGEPDLMTLVIHIIAKTETQGSTWPVTEPAIPETAPYTPYVIQDLDTRLLVNSVAMNGYSFHFMYDNNLDVKYAMSTAPTSICAGLPRIKLSGRFPWDTTHDNLYGISYAGQAASFQFQYTSGAATYSTLFTLNNLKVPAAGPYIKDEGGVRFEIEGDIYGTTSTTELIVTNDMS